MTLINRKIQYFGGKFQPGAIMGTSCWASGDGVEMANGKYVNNSFRGDGTGGNSGKALGEGVGMTRALPWDNPENGLGYGGDWNDNTMTKEQLDNFAKQLIEIP